MEWVAPLALEDILVWKLSGTMTIFIFIALIAIAILAARWRMPNVVFGGVVMMFIVFVGLGSVLGFGSPLAGFLLLGLIIIGITIAEILKRMQG